MEKHAKVVVRIIGLVLGGIATGFIAVAISQDALNAYTLYLTGVGILMTGAGCWVAAPFYQRFCAVESALTSHKRHDREALERAIHFDPQGD